MIGWIGLGLVVFAAQAAFRMAFMFARIYDEKRSMQGTP